LIGHAKHVLLASGNGFEVLPTGYIQEVIVLGIDGTCDRVIGCKNCHGLIGSLPIFPFNMEIVDDFMMGGADNPPHLVDQLACLVTTDQEQFEQWIGGKSFVYHQ
jgi:hypothetical protein